MTPIMTEKPSIVTVYVTGNVGTGHAIMVYMTADM